MQRLIVVIADVGRIRVVRSKERLFIHSHGWSNSDCFTSATRCSFQYCEHSVTVYTVHVHSDAGGFAPRRIGLSHCALSPSPSSSLLSHFVVITPVSMRPLGLPTVRLDSRRCHVTPVDIAGWAWVEAASMAAADLAASLLRAAFVECSFNFLIFAFLRIPISQQTITWQYRCQELSINVLC